MKEILKRIIENRKIALSSILSFLLIVGNYFVNNLPIFTYENLNQYHFTQVFCELLGIRNDFYDDDFFVNVSYDKEIAIALDESGDVIGNTAVTDRKKLYDFLSILKEEPKYKYIIVDLRFDKNDVTEHDSKLYDLICSMDNIVVVRDDKFELPNQLMKDKSAYADYYSTVTATNFVRYLYLDSIENRYIPLKVFEDLNPHLKIKRYGLGLIPFYTSGDSLCQRTSFIKFSSNFTSFSKSKEKRADLTLGFMESQTYFNLGRDLLYNQEFETEIEVKQNIIDKSEDSYVVIGNYTEDLHDTYMGLKPGPYILYRALKTLENRSNVVNIFFVIYWFIIYMVIFYFIITQKHILNLFVKIKNKWYNFLYFFVDMLGYTTIILIFSTIEYVSNDTINSFVLPIVIFSISKLVFNYKKFNLEL